MSGISVFYPWSRLRTALNLEGSELPLLIESLASETDTTRLWDKYWPVEFHLKQQGALCEAAEAVTCLSLFHLTVCTQESRVFFLEIISQAISSDPNCAENAIIVTRCIRQTCYAYWIFVALLYHGTDNEKSVCIDILYILASLPDFRNEIIQYFQDARAKPAFLHAQELLDNCLSDLSRNINF